MPLLVHGFAHISGFLASWTKKDRGFKDNPWLITADVSLQSSLGRAFGIIWLMSMIAFVGAGAGVILKQSWWPEAALSGSVLSLIVILPWWKTVVSGAKIGAIFDLLVIGLVLSPWKEQLIDIVSKGLNQEFAGYQPASQNPHPHSRFTDHLIWPV